MANHFNGDLGKSLTFLLAETVPLFNLLTITISYRFIDAHYGFYSALYLCNKKVDAPYVCTKMVLDVPLSNRYG
jgi:hypothetical protein